MADVELECTYAQDVTTVWLAVTDRRALSAWLMPTDDFVAEVGAPLTFRTPRAPGFDGAVRGEVLEVDRPRRLAFSWRSGSVDTVVTITLAPADGGGTHLRLAHTGFTGLRGRVVSQVLARGWQRLLDRRLRAAVLLLVEADPSELDVELVARTAGDRDDGPDVRGIIRRWTDV